jgi:hypothetical protein
MNPFEPNAVLGSDPIPQMKNKLANSVFTVATFAILNKKPKNPEGCQISLILQVTWFSAKRGQYYL